MSLLDANSPSQIDPVRQQEAEFNRAIDRAEMNVSIEWDFEGFNIESDVDETLTNVMQNLGQSQMILLQGMTRFTT
jgi:hypothetical protein